MKMEKLIVKCEDYDFCELWKRDVCILEVVLRCVFLKCFCDCQIIFEVLFVKIIL